MMPTVAFLVCAGLLTSMLGLWLISEFRAWQQSRFYRRAGQQFRWQREGLELRFLRRVALEDSDALPYWEAARWLDEVIWARDRHTGDLLAMVGVEVVEPNDSEWGLETLYDQQSEVLVHRATVIFIYRHGYWQTDGLWVDDIHPAEACRNRRRFEILMALTRY